MARPPSFRRGRPALLAQIWPRTSSRQPAASKKSPAVNTAPSNTAGKAGNKKGGKQDPKQGNILSFFKKKT